MKATRCSGRTRAHWMTLMVLCGTLGGLPAAAHADDKIGTVIGVPVSELSRFDQVNAFPSRTGSLSVAASNVRVLHTSPFMGGPFNAAIATVSINLKSNGDPARQVFFPIDSNGSVSPLFALINASDVFSNPQVNGTGTSAALQVDVLQSDAAKLDFSRTRFMMVPSDRVGSLEVTNPGVKFKSIHLQRASLGGNLLWVQLVAIDDCCSSNIQIPTVDLLNTIMALNSNVEIHGIPSFNQTTSVAVR
jgi:hypothetical protein